MRAAFSPAARSAPASQGGERGFRARAAGFLQARHGHTAIEYSMIGAFIAIGIIAAVSAIGLSVEDMFNDLLPAFAGKPES